MSKLVDVARGLRAWASENGLLTFAPAEEDEESIDLSELTTQAQAEATEQIMRIRKINFIGVDDDSNKIIVYTQKVPTKAEMHDLPLSLDGDILLEFRRGSLPTIRNTTGKPINVAAAATHNGRYSCGSSIFVGNREGAGTLGCLVKNAVGDLFGLSNNHVTGGMSFSDASLPITAPGVLDVCAGGPDPFTIGHHKTALNLAYGSPDNANVSDNYDAAIFAIKHPDQVTSMQRTFFDTPSVVSSMKANTVVEKVGRTTGRTKGTVTCRAVSPQPVQTKIPGIWRSKRYIFRRLLGGRRNE